MAGKTKVTLEFEMSDGTKNPVSFEVMNGVDGKNGTNGAAGAKGDKGDAGAKGADGRGIKSVTATAVQVP